MSDKQWPPRVWLYFDGNHPYDYRVRHDPIISGADAYLSLEEANHLIAQARAEAFEEAAKDTHGPQGFAELRRLYLTKAARARAGSAATEKGE